MTVTDDDTPAVVLGKTSLTVAEGDAAGTSYTVKLATRPSGSVAVSITGHAGTDLTLDKTTLTFTVDNWDVVQTVAVTAAQDDDAVTDVGVTLTHTVSGGGYSSTTVPDVEVSITENDSAGLVISKDSLTVGEGDAAGSSYTVKLATRPSGSVTVSISGHDGTDLTLSGTTLTNNMLTFTVGNWDAAQTVTVTAGQDDDGVNDTATLTHTASGGDYASITADLLVTVTDDDSRRVVLSEMGLIVTEGDAAGSSYTREAGHRADGRGRRDHLRPCGHGPEPIGNHVEQQHADLHGGELGHGADGDGQGGRGRRRRQRHRDADARRVGRGLRQRHQEPAREHHRRRGGR